MKQEQRVRYNLKLDWDVPFFFFWVGGNQALAWIKPCPSLLLCFYLSYLCNRGGLAQSLANRRKYVLPPALHDGE